MAALTRFIRALVLAMSEDEIQSEKNVIYEGTVDPHECLRRRCVEREVVILIDHGISQERQIRSESSEHLRPS